MTDNKTITDLIDSLDSLKGNIEQYRRGRNSAYKDVAVQLYKLLFNEQGSDNKSITKRVFADSALHPLRRNMPTTLLNDPALVFKSNALIAFDGKGGFEIKELFDEKSTPIQISNWLNQILFNQKITIRELIKSIRDKEAAHSDPNYNNTLKFTKEIKIIDTDSQAAYLVAIGEYVLKSLTTICKHFKIIN